VTFEEFWEDCGHDYHSSEKLVVKHCWEVATAAERERLGRPPPGQYRCGCPLVVCDNVKAFCPAHHKCIVPGGEPT
jgi:hypothetical protein